MGAHIVFVPATGGSDVEVSIDADGDMQLELQMDERLTTWVRPRDMVRALRTLGVLDAPETLAERTPDASARVRSSWLRSAGTDDDERSQIAMHATTARLRRATAARNRERVAQERARHTATNYFVQADRGARLYGSLRDAEPKPQTYRDARGRRWVTGPMADRIHPVHANGARGAGFRRVTIERIFGPLEPVSDEYERARTQLAGYAWRKAFQ